MVGNVPHVPYKIHQIDLAVKHVPRRGQKIIKFHPLDLLILFPGGQLLLLPNHLLLLKQVFKSNKLSNLQMVPNLMKLPNPLEYLELQKRSKLPQQ